MKFGVVIFPGSNCDEDTVYALETNMQQEVVRLWHKDRDLQNVDFVILPGGFSYGDYLRSGAIARFSPIMDEIIAFAKKGGYVLGICNGFQILTEAGLLPGALVMNVGQKFICDNIYIKPDSKKNILTAGLQNKAHKIPIAHGEGRFYCSPDTIQEIYENDQILFKYCDAKGRIHNKWNPNGSVDNIAGLCSKEGNVFGMMPHPERASDPELGNEDGKLIFQSILNSLEPVSG